MKLKLPWGSILSDKAGGTLLQRIFVVLIIAALMATFLPTTSVFAAPASVSEDDDLEQIWRNKISYVRAQSLFYSQVRVFPADFDDLSDLAQAHEFLNKYGFALRRAQTIIFTRAGFDERGRVIDEEQAIQSIEDLNENLRIMRAMRMKLEVQGYKIHLFR